MTARRCLLVTLWLLARAPASAATTLPNGITLPEHWPPQVARVPDSAPTPPWLANPPAVIPIDLGRQLFVDDFLIDHTTMTRTYYRPEVYPGNPVVRPDQPWERTGDGPMATAGSLWVDPADGKFKMWYGAGYNGGTALAVSDDGIHWTKPDLGGGNNLIRPLGTGLHNVWLDPSDPDPRRRFKAFNLRGSAEGVLLGRYSADGVHWCEPIWTSGKVGDATTLFYNPLLQKWILSVRDSFNTDGRGRARRYWEWADFNHGPAVSWWGDDLTKVPLWLGADRGQDPPLAVLGIEPQLYILHAEAYESLLLGQFDIFRGYWHADSGQGRAVVPGRPKANEVFLGFSRDGYHWHRPMHQPFVELSATKGDWNWGNVRSASPAFVIVGDRIYFYYNGRAGLAMPGAQTVDAGGATGLAFLRRDGFASMDAGATEATLTTRPVRFSGRRLFVNLDAPEGELRVEVLNSAGQVIAPFSQAACVPVRANATLREVRWTGAADLSAVAGKEVRFRFHLTNGRLYAFWVSPDASGASHGYLATGAPGQPGLTDTAGAAAYLPAHRAPWAQAGADLTVRDTDGDGAETVTLDGSGSVFAHGPITGYAWYAGVHPLATGAKARATLPVGTHRVTLEAAAGGGPAGYDSLQVTVLPRQDPILPPGQLVLWLAADQLRGLADGAPVGRWPDASGNALDPFQDDPARRPSWHAAAAHGRPAVRFDGATAFLRTNFYRGLMFSFHQSSIFVVFRPAGRLTTASLVSQDWPSFGTSDRGLSYTTAYDESARTQWTGVAAAQPGALAPDQWSIGSLVHSGADPGGSRLDVNGQRVDDGTAALPYHRTNADFGLIGLGRDNRGYWPGDIAEIIIYGRALSEAERVAVTRYLAEKYTIPLQPAQ